MNLRQILKYSKIRLSSNDKGELEMKEKNQQECTKERFPIVNKQTLERLSKELFEKLSAAQGADCGQSYCQNFAQTLSKENPDLADFYMAFLHGCLLHPKSPPLKTETAYMLGFIVSYRALKLQGESNGVHEDNYGRIGT